MSASVCGQQLRAPWLQADSSGLKAGPYKTIRADVRVIVDDVSGSSWRSSLKEPSYNLFVYSDTSMIEELGVSVHDLDGTDLEKVTTLKNLVASDCRTAARYKMKRPMTSKYYEGISRLGRELELFEEIFQDINAAKQPLVVITPVINEKPFFELSMKLGPILLDDLKGTPYEKPGKMVDYLDAYVTDEGFDIPRLLNDDYFRAIKLLFNERYFMSCAKLLLSFIDTVAFIDTGDNKGNFIPWLDTYADIASLGITSKELWEFRNGLLHMSNLHSRAVASGKTARLILSVGRPTQPLPVYSNGEKRFNLKDLIDTVAYAVSRWIDTYNHAPEKLPDFVNRYDLTVSDTRVADFSIDDSHEAQSTPDLTPFGTHKRP
jgi:hypothetical protein